MKSLLRLDRLGIWCTSSAQIRLKDVVEATVWHTVLMKTIWSLGHLFSKKNISARDFELNCIIEFAVMLMSWLIRVDDIVLDIATNVAQWRMLKIAPEGVDEFVCESCTSFGGSREGGEDTDEEFSSSTPVS
jgi:hypothetical protein